MKKLYFLAITLIMASSSFAQQVDMVAVGFDNPDTNMAVPQNWNDTIVMVIATLGPDTIKTGDTISCSLTISGFNFANPGVIAPQDIPPGNAFGLSFPYDLGTLPIAPPVGQQANLCFTVNYSKDTLTNNNQYCNMITIGAPTAPATVWGNQLNEFDFFPRNKELVLVNNQNALDIQVVNTIGQVVVNESNFTNNTLSLQNLKSGFYVINAVDINNRSRKTKKVYIK
jgi:hypothetical protein